MKYLLAVIAGIIITLAAGLLFFKGGQFLPISLQNLLSKPTSTGLETPTPTPTPKPTKTVTAGGILSFPKYQLTVPTDWLDEKEVLGPDAERLILTRGSYQITITEGGFGGSICLFPGDADIEGPSARYDTYVELTTQSGNLFRRVGTTSGGGFAICEKTQYGWNSPASFGHISIKTPTTADPQMLSEIDSILVSFQIQ